MLLFKTFYIRGKQEVGGEGVGQSVNIIILCTSIQELCNIKYYHYNFIFYDMTMCYNKKSPSTPTPPSLHVVSKKKFMTAQKELFSVLFKCNLISLLGVFFELNWKEKSFFFFFFPKFYCLKYLYFNLLKW